MPTFCTECGTQHQDEDLYCLKCGVKLIAKASAKRPFLSQTDLPITQPESSYRREANQIQTEVITSQLKQMKLAFGVFGVLGLILLLDYFIRFFWSIYDLFGSIIGVMVFTVPFVGAYLFLAISLYNYKSEIEVNNSLSKEGRTIGQLLLLVTVMFIIDGILQLIFITDYFTYYSIGILMWLFTDLLIFNAFYKLSKWLGTILTLSDIRTSFQLKLLWIFSVLLLVNDSFNFIYFFVIDLDIIFFDGIYIIIQLVRTITGFSIYSILNQIKR
ncbi:MAG: zinc-ribbon domain-containing protein [Candidatus Hodarchaeales archaeon]|jgi:hypothetical protein